MTNWIGVYDNALTSEECRFVINEFEKRPGKKPGLISGGEHRRIDKSKKDSLDLLLPLDEGSPLTDLFCKTLFEKIPNYREDYPYVDLIDKWGLSRGFNIQRYLPGQGFHSPHCETDSKDEIRVLAWMIYLNTVTDGGETRFPAYDLNVKPVEGRLVIWPAYFTHIHHGLTSNTQTKYISTGWFVFE